MGLGFSLAGAAAGYQGFKEEQRRTDEDARKAEQDAQAVKDNAYKNEIASRQRYEWSETDRKRDEGKKFDADYRARHRMSGDPDDPAPVAPPAIQDEPQAVPAPQSANRDVGAGGPAVPFDSDLAGPPQARAIGPASSAQPAGAALPNMPIDSELAGAPQQRAISSPASATAPLTPGAAPASAMAKASGIPQPRPMGNILDMYANRINNAAQRGDATVQEYAATREFLAKARNEGVTQAITAWSRGDYAGGLALYNGMGQYNGATIVGTPVDAMTKLPNGQVVPTHIITIQNADKSRSVIDTAADEYKLQSLDARMKQGEEAAKLAETAKFHGDSIAVANKNADTLAGHRTDQGTNMKEQRRLQAEENRIAAAKGSGGGAKLDAKAIDAEVERNPQLYSVAQDDTGKDVSIGAAKSLYHNMLIRLGNPDKAYLTMTQIKADAIKLATDPKTGAVNQAQYIKAFGDMVAQADQRMRTTPVPAAAPSAAKPTAPGEKSAAPPAKNEKPAPGQVKPAAQAVDTRNAVDVRNDIVLSSLDQALAKLDLNDVKNMDVVIKLGNARNERLTQLQNDNGKYTRLITK